MFLPFNVFEVVTLRRNADGSLVLVSGDPAADDCLVVVVIESAPAIIALAA